VVRTGSGGENNGTWLQSVCLVVEAGEFRWIVLDKEHEQRVVHIIVSHTHCSIFPSPIFIFVEIQVEVDFLTPSC
jgi:hypothetical protein